MKKLFYLLLILGILFTGNIVEASTNTVVYYYDEYDTETGHWDNPSYMVDGLLSTFSSETHNSANHLISTNCPALNLGTITKVEIRAYGYTANPGDTIRLDPVYDSYGDVGASFDLTGSPEWTDWADITTATYMPNPWSWTDFTDETGLVIQVIRNEVEGATMYCAKVELRITYTTPDSIYDAIQIAGD
jgi:hypothetical protein